MVKAGDSADEGSGWEFFNKQKHKNLHFLYSLLWRFLMEILKANVILWNQICFWSSSFQIDDWKSRQEVEMISQTFLKLK